MEKCNIVLSVIDMTGIQTNQKKHSNVEGLNTVINKLDLIDI